MSKRKEIPDVMSRLQGLGGPPSPPAAEEEETAPPETTERRPPTPRRKPKRRTPRSRLAGRATYDIGPELKEYIRQESIDLGIPASQLAKYLLYYATDLYADGRIPEPPLERSESPRFRHTVDFDQV